MSRRLVTEETGMTMGLTVIMVVLIGVMGAGLLTFVQRDLEAVIEVNRGQRAAEVSDAGVQAAKRQLLADSFPGSYDSSGGDNSNWAYNSANVPCGTLPSGPGQCITTADGEVRVTIRYLPPPTDLIGTGSGSRRDSNYAPENPPAVGVDYTDKRDYFRVESDGVLNSARRKIQAIMVTEDIGLPKAYFATKNINLDGSASVANVSLFAKTDITGIKCDSITGQDLAYGTWMNAYNDKSRLDSTRTTAVDPNAAGVAAEGSVNYVPGGGPACSGFSNNGQKGAPASTTDFYKRRDFDGLSSYGSGIADPGTLSPPDPNYRFCDRNTACWPTSSPSQPTDVITYPFNDGAKLNADFLQSIAEQQIRPGAGSAASRDNYVEMPGGPSSSVTLSNSTTGGAVQFNQVSHNKLASVFVVRFTGSQRGEVIYSPNTSGFSPPSGPTNPCPTGGTIVVVNGSFITSSADDRCFDGVVSVQDPNDLGTLEYRNQGNFSLNGFTNIQGTMELRGTVNPILGADVLNQPGYHNVRVWSWRECYNTSCS